MSSTAPMISVVVPLHNEAENVGPLVRAIQEALEPLRRPYEVLLVNDGSTDETGQLLDQFAGDDPRIFAIHLDVNYGQAEALSAGFERAVGETIVTLDGDLQNDPADLPGLIRMLEERNLRVVSGWRHARAERSFLRVIPSRIANFLIARVTGLPSRDNGCSLKAYRREVVKGTYLTHGMHRFIPAVYGIRSEEFAQVPVSHRARQSGTSHYGLSRLFAVLKALPILPLIQKGVSESARLLAALQMYAAVLFLSGCVLTWGLHGMRPELHFVIPLCLIGLALVLASYAEYGRRAIAEWSSAQQQKPFRLRGEARSDGLEHAPEERKAAASRAST